MDKSVIAILEEEKQKIEFNINKLKSSNESKLTKEAIKSYLEANKDLSKKSFEVQKKIINSFVESIIVYENIIEINLVVPMGNGGGGNRTPVRRSIHKSFSHHSRYFNIPSF